MFFGACGIESTISAILLTSDYVLLNIKTVKSPLPVTGVLSNYCSMRLFYTKKTLCVANGISKQQRERLH